MQAVVAVECEAFELPQEVDEGDRILLHNVLSAMRAGPKCREYKVDVVETGFLVRGTLSSDVFEVDSDDLFFISSVSPLRVERVAVSRAAGCNELVVKVLNCKQRVMVTASASFFASSAVKKRRLA